ncbi:MAG TPA: molybdate ABC transporter substrate-binding protein [Candidatus Binatia bacterium]|nr:molybdate ABC transporter substrate-binding protein [Candidatus Binatia bacterium]
MTRRAFIGAGLALQAALAAPVHSQATPASSGTVVVFAAASLTGAFQALGAEFEKSHPDLKVQFNFGGSPTLVQQIQQGAPADVFASADEANMKKLADSGALAGAARPFARNQLQIAVPAGNPKRIEALGDLTKPGLTIALCGPTVPCGRYAAEAFSKAGVTPPAASQELDVKAVLTKVSLGEADAGIVYVTDVRAAGTKVTGVDIPESLNVIARYPIAAVKNAPSAATAAAVIDFVLSPDGQRILASFGFLPP